jgi:hypothetical protein
MPDYRNAKAEFIDEVEGKPVLCAEVSYEFFHKEQQKYVVKNYWLLCAYDPAKYDAFLQSLDFVYNAGFGGQELYGVIWYADGTWSERYVYDGEEEWVHCRVPVVPEHLKKTKQ